MNAMPPCPARVALIALLSATACASQGQVLEPTVELQPGILEFYDQPVQITTPDTVAVGAPATIEVKTYGGGCVSKGETRVTVEGLLAVVEPLDSVITPSPEAACTDELRFFSHIVTVEFTERGTATLRVRGRRMPAGELLEADRIIVVQ